MRPRTFAREIAFQVLYREDLNPVPEGSAAQQAAAVLGGSTVVGAFHHVSAPLLLDPGVAELDMDVLVLGDDRNATDLVQGLAERIPGVRGVYAGRQGARSGVLRGSADVCAQLRR